jgi:uncharacterized protein (TIGR02145 family)
VKQQPTPQPVPTPKPKPKPTPTKNIDRDGDGLTNDVDRCPDQKGPISNYGCPEEDIPKASVNVSGFASVKIGTREWMLENLDVDRFQNGDLIPEARTNEEWKQAEKDKTPAWCYYDNNPANGKKYGKLYNFYAIKDPRKLAPKGWRMPSWEDWAHSVAQLGGEKVAGGKMKSNLYWNSPNTDASNSSQFTGLPGGEREPSGKFIELGDVGSYWTTHSYPHTSSPGYTYVVARTLKHDYPGVSSKYFFTGVGWSVRCVKD